MWVLDGIRITVNAWGKRNIILGRHQINKNHYSSTSLSVIRMVRAAHHYSGLVQVFLDLGTKESPLKGSSIASVPISQVVIIIQGPEQHNGRLQDWGLGPKSYLGDLII